MTRTTFSALTASSASACWKRITQTTAAASTTSAPTVHYGRSCRQPPESSRPTRAWGLIRWIGVTGHGSQIAATHRRSSNGSTSARCCSPVTSSPRRTVLPRQLQVVIHGDVPLGMRTEADHPHPAAKVLSAQVTTPVLFPSRVTVSPAEISMARDGNRAAARAMVSELTSPTNCRGFHAG
jgi:hypothetical protein